MPSRTLGAVPPTAAANPVLHPGAADGVPDNPSTAALGRDNATSPANHDLADTGGLLDNVGNDRTRHDRRTAFRPESATTGGGHARRWAAAGGGRGRHGQDGHFGTPGRLADCPRRRSGADPVVDVHAAGGGRDASPGRPAAAPVGPPGHDARLGRHVPRHRHPPAAPLRQGHRAPSGIHGPRPGRFRRPHECRPHRARLGQDRQTVPQEGHLHGDLQPLRQRPRKTRPRARRTLHLVPRLAGRAEAAVRRLRGP